MRRARARCMSTRSTACRAPRPSAPRSTWCAAAARLGGAQSVRLGGAPARAAPQCGTPGAPRARTASAACPAAAAQPCSQAGPCCAAPYAQRRAQRHSRPARPPRACRQRCLHAHIEGRPARPAQEVQARRLLALADEEGYVTVVDAGAPLPSDLHLGYPPAWNMAGEPLPRPRAQWEAHKNAVFDLAWAKARPARGALTLTPAPDCARAALHGLAGPAALSDSPQRAPAAGAPARAGRAAPRPRLTAPLGGAARAGRHAHADGVRRPEPGAVGHAERAPRQLLHRPRRQRQVRVRHADQPRRVCVRRALLDDRQTWLNLFGLYYSGPWPACSASVPN
jgi:hypothetical protein